MVKLSKCHVGTACRRYELAKLNAQRLMPGTKSPSRATTTWRTGVSAITVSSLWAKFSRMTMTVARPAVQLLGKERREVAAVALPVGIAHAHAQAFEGRPFRMGPTGFEQEGMQRRIGVAACPPA